MSTTRDKLKKKQCFQIYDMPEWDRGGEVVSLRAMTPSDRNKLLENRPKEDSDVKAQDIFAYRAFSHLLGDAAGNRIYGDTDDDLKEIEENIPQKVILRFVADGFEYNADVTKKK